MGAGSKQIIKGEKKELYGEYWRRKAPEKEKKGKGWRKDQVYDWGIKALVGEGGDEGIQSEGNIELVNLKEPKKLWPLVLYQPKTNELYCRDRSMRECPEEKDPDLEEVQDVRMPEGEGDLDGFDHGESTRDSGSSGRRMPKDGLPGKVLAITFVPG